MSANNTIVALIIFYIVMSDHGKRKTSSYADGYVSEYELEALKLGEPAKFDCIHESVNMKRCFLQHQRSNSNNSA